MADVLLLSSGRAAVAEPTLVDGAASPLLLDTKGRLLVAQKPAVFALQSAGLVAVNDALPINVEDSAMLVLHVKNYGTVTLAAGTFVFEASLDSTNGTDGTWFGIQAARTNSNNVETTTALSGITAGAAFSYGWRVGTAGYKWVRVRCTVAVTASAIAFWQGIESPNSVDPAPGVPVHAVTQSGAWTTAMAAPTTTNVISAATNNAQVIKGSAGSLYGLTVFNPTAAIIYVKLYNKATTPVPATGTGSDAPVLVIPVAINGSERIFPSDYGVRFSAGIGLAIVAGPTNTDNVSVAVGALVGVTFV